MTAWKLQSCLHCAWPLQEDNCQSIPVGIILLLTDLLVRQHEDQPAPDFCEVQAFPFRGSWRRRCCRLHWESARSKRCSICCAHSAARCCSRACSRQTPTLATFSCRCNERRLNLVPLRYRLQCYSRGQPDSSQVSDGICYAGLMHNIPTASFEQITTWGTPLFIILFLSENAAARRRHDWTVCKPSCCREADSTKIQKTLLKSEQRRSQRTDEKETVAEVWGPAFGRAGRRDTGAAGLWTV